MSLETQSVADAEAAMTLIEQAAHDAVPQLVVEDENGALSRADLVPVDAAAREALAAEDLGPGINSERRRTSW
jgi:hypothetical protein